MEGGEARFGKPGVRRPVSSSSGRSAIESCPNAQPPADSGVCRLESFSDDVELANEVWLA